MGSNFSILILVFFIIFWSNQQFTQLRKTAKNEGLDTLDLLEYIRSLEIRIIFLFVGIFIMFMGLR